MMWVNSPANPYGAVTDSTPPRMGQCQWRDRVSDDASRHVGGTREAIREEG